MMLAPCLPSPGYSRAEGVQCWTIDEDSTHIVIPIHIVPVGIVPPHKLGYFITQDMSVSSGNAFSERA